ncbi:hypothetical protein FOA52_010912 [Chlamydomonas sp. UWO 241]|nr:hypothetical protein FOA52_010912 [Chlamydomonas sp. UWO 241]
MQAISKRVGGAPLSRASLVCGPASVLVRSPVVGGRSSSSLQGVAPLLPVRNSAPEPRHAVVVKSTAGAGDEGAVKALDPLESAVAKVFGEKNAVTVVTVGYILLWYALNVGFNLLNKSIFKYFPFPWTVSTVHVVVGLAYCMAMYAIGLKDASFGRVITKKEFGAIFGPASMHAIGHVAANLSFAAVAISLTHTVKTLEPAFNVVLSSLVLGQSTPLPAVLSLIPIIVGVGLASAGELSFNWMGFLTAMASNLTFSFRAVWSKVAMATTKIESTALYAYTTLISVIICTPLALIAEGSTLQRGRRSSVVTCTPLALIAEGSPLQAGVDTAIAKVGAQQFWGDLLMVGLLYHLYNQFAFNTLQRVSPVSHGVCNVVKRIAIIFSSVVFFNQVMTTQALVGTSIAIFGTYLYTQFSGHGAHKKETPKAA